MYFAGLPEYRSTVFSIGGLNGILREVNPVASLMAASYSSVPSQPAKIQPGRSPFSSQASR